MKKTALFLSLLFISNLLFSAPYKSKVWVSDLGNGRYKNPVINADYPELDICKNGDNYYMISASGHTAPSLPILASKDLVNWQFVTYVLPASSEILATADAPRAIVNPCLRVHKNTFYVLFSNPEKGIYMCRTNDIAKGWSKPELIMEGKNLSTACPVWDEKDNLFLIHGYEQKLPRHNNLIALCKLDENFKPIRQSEIIIYDGNDEFINLKGAKIIRKNNFYYIFACVGKQFDHQVLCLRSEKIAGPYESQVVMYQASSSMEGPYFGGYTETPNGEAWYMHNQHVENFGNVVMLDPIKWSENWPTIGSYVKGGNSEPITNFKKPALPPSSVATPYDDDDFSRNALGAQWQWNAQPKPFWHFFNKKDQKVRLYSETSNGDLRTLPNILLQKLPSQAFMMTTKMTLAANDVNARCGVVLLGKNYAQICIKRTNGDNHVLQTESKAGGSEVENQRNIIKPNEIYFRIKVREGLIASFSYSLDGEIYYVLGKEFQLSEMDDLGSRIGFYCTHPENAKDISWCDIEYVEFAK